jgi:hypothetical protein
VPGWLHAIQEACIAPAHVAVAVQADPCRVHAHKGPAGCIMGALGWPFTRLAVKACMSAACNQDRTMDHWHSALARYRTSSRLPRHRLYRLLVH